MAGTQELDQFVRDALMKGCSRESIEQALSQAGWAQEQVRAAMAAYADVAFAVPVPRPRAYLSAKEAFLYLVMFTTLYLSAYYFGRLLFELINRYFQDVAAPYGSWNMGRIRWSVAAIIIAFPIFLTVSTIIGRECHRQTIKRQSPVRRWLAYMTLFFAASVLIGDLIALVNNLLGGETTVRFMLKVWVVGAIAGTVFGYYLWDLRRDERGV